MPYDKQVETIKDAKDFITYLLNNRDENINANEHPLLLAGRLIEGNLSEEDKKRMVEICKYESHDPYNSCTPQDLSLDLYTLEFVAQLNKENKKKIEEAQEYVTLNSIIAASDRTDADAHQFLINRLDKLEKWANVTQTLTILAGPNAGAAAHNVSDIF